MSAPSPASTAAAKPAEVYFYGTCLVDLIYPQAGLAAVELIEQAGVRVIFPQDQTCCGQPPFNSGYRDEARTVAREQIRLFPKPIPIVVPSGSCGAMMAVHYPDLFHGEPDEAEARAFAARVVEWSDFAARVLGLRLQDRGAPCRVAYHPSCHLLREMGVEQAPLDLLAQLGNVTLAELPDARECCGFGGTFAIKMSEISEAMVADKCRAVEESGAEVLVSCDSGCLMNIGGALKKHGSAVRVLPLAAFLRERTGATATAEQEQGDD